MSELNLHGRLPEDLPDKETIDDILLELEDTKKFEINWVSLNPILYGNPPDTLIGRIIADYDWD